MRFLLSSKESQSAEETIVGTSRQKSEKLALHATQKVIRTAESYYADRLYFKAYRALIFWGVAGVC